MPQYLILAQDDTDEQALERRMQTRPLHLEGANQLKKEGHFIIGGATLNNDGNMNGSVMILDFDTDEQFQEWYRNEPYINKGVWKHIEIKPFKVAAI